MQVRLAREDDLNNVVALLEQFSIDDELANVNWQDSRRSYKEILTGDRGDILVAESDHQLAGLVTLSYALVLRFGGEYALIEDFIVCKKYRGKGVGGLLLDEVISLAKRKGCRELQVNGASQSGAPVYLKKGLHHVGTHLKLTLVCD